MNIRTVFAGGLVAAVLALTYVWVTNPATESRPTVRFTTSFHDPRAAPALNQSEAYDNAHRFVVTWLRQDLDTTVWRARLTELATLDLRAEIGGVAEIASDRLLAISPSVFRRAFPWSLPSAG